MIVVFGEYSLSSWRVLSLLDFYQMIFLYLRLPCVFSFNLFMWYVIFIDFLILIIFVFLR
jgi:hypothetical protein